MDSSTPAGIEKIESFSRYGTLMKIYKESTSDYIVKDKIKVNKLVFTGLTFVRFKVISMAKRDVGYVATIEILTDEITKDVELALIKKKLIDRLKTELKTFYECTQKQVDADIKKFKLESETRINKLVFTTIGDL